MGRLFIIYPDSSPFFESDDKLSDQPAGLLGAYFAIVLFVTPFISKYTEENLQQILKTVLKAWAPTTFEEF